MTLEHSVNRRVRLVGPLWLLIFIAGDAGVASPPPPSPNSPVATIEAILQILERSMAEADRPRFQRAEIAAAENTAKLTLDLHAAHRAWAADPSSASLARVAGVVSLQVTLSEMEWREAVVRRILAEQYPDSVRLQLQSAIARLAEKLQVVRLAEAARSDAHSARTQLENLLRVRERSRQAAAAAGGEREATNPYGTLLPAPAPPQPRHGGEIARPETEVAKPRVYNLPSGLPPM